MTAIESTFLMVERRCATTTVVLPTIRRSRASCTMLSEPESRALVASSRSKIFGFFNIALAIAILWNLVNEAFEGPDKEIFKDAF
ncbi:hypothetical protein Ccrd_012503 [Cynara cardunculus var. scolymus]|uniref:Uncharacterized protein n=1 Tax=Cynara cardunculus var. scolymus TaxID=59895 RepID=A0A103YHD4_CYNCS|nr:hypothetical protein Ccrd_012503 [Cynara cardunculus var. scolymus]